MVVTIPSVTQTLLIALITSDVGDAECVKCRTSRLQQRAFQMSMITDCSYDYVVLTFQSAIIFRQMGLQATLSWK